VNAVVSLRVEYKAVDLLIKFATVSFSKGQCSVKFDLADV
jgi:hypothetical protein